MSLCVYVFVSMFVGGVCLCGECVHNASLEFL